MAAANVASKLFGDTINTVYAITHGITAATPVVQIFDAGTNTLVTADVVVTSSTVVTVTLAMPAPSTNAYRCNVVG